MRFRVRFGLARAAPGGHGGRRAGTSGDVVKPPFGSNNGGFTVCLCIFSPYAFSWGGKRGIKGVTIQVWQPPALPERMATVERSEQQWKHRSSASYVWARRGETGVAVLPVWQSMAHLDLTRRRGDDQYGRAAVDFNERCSDRRGSGRCKPFRERCVPH